MDIICRVEKLPKGAQLVAGRRELAFGEATGHAHRLDVGEIFKDRDGTLYFKSDKPVTLTHEEHKAIGTEVLSPGIYQFSSKRQYLPNTWEPVQD